MRKCGRIFGIILLALGLIIILALVLPAGAWWFILGLAFVAAGICFLRR